MDLARRVRPHAGAIAVVALSAVLHLWDLGDRPLAHDEAIDAWFSWEARDGAVMRYDPTYHGPLRFYLEGFILDTFGTTAAWARTLAALAGIGTTALIACSRRTLGRIGAPVAALLLTISPTVLTVTRTGREDALIVLATTALLLLVARALVAPRPAHLVGASVILAASFATKESTFLLSLSAATFAIPALLVAWRRPEGEARAAVRRLRSLGLQPVLWSAMAFALTFSFVFTSGFRYPAGLESGALDGLRYWWGQHDVGRGGQPWFFHLAIWAAYDWLLVGLALAGTAVVVRRGSLVGAWFASMALTQALLYTWAGEKFSWLAVHPLVPAVLVAGIGAEALWHRARTGAGRTVLVGAGAALSALTLAIAVPPAISDGADPAELLVNVQTAEPVPAVADRLAAAQAAGKLDRILVDAAGGAAWPWSWYLIELDGVEYQLLDLADLPDGYDAIIVLAPGTETPEVPDGFVLERFSYRVWWVPDYDGASVGDLLRWAVTREVWSPTASLDQYLLIREDAVG